MPEYNEDGTLKIERAQDDDSEPEDEDEKMKRAEASRRLENDEYLSRAYKYGSDLIPISREEEVDFYTFPAGDAGLFVRGFVKAADVSDRNDVCVCTAIRLTLSHLRLPVPSRVGTERPILGLWWSREPLPAILLGAAVGSERHKHTRPDPYAASKECPTETVPADTAGWAECSLRDRRNGPAHPSETKQFSQSVAGSELNTLHPAPFQRRSCQLEFPLPRPHTHDDRPSCLGAPFAPEEGPPRRYGRLRGLDAPACLRRRG